MDTSQYEALDFLEGRIQRLERICVGENIEGYSAKGGKLNFQERIRSVEKRLLTLDANVPELKPVLDNLNRIMPILNLKKSSLKGTMEAMNLILLRKDELEKQFQTMQSIQQLSHVIDIESFLEVDNLKGRLEKLELDMLLIKPRVAAQMREIDDLIDVYEKGMLFLSKVIQSREIKAMEQEK